MKKIMFNDKYGLTQAVLDGGKTMTRREITIPKKWNGIEVRGYFVCKNIIGQIITYLTDYDDMEIERSYISPKYKVGEIVAVAQSYKNLFNEDCKRAERCESIINVPINNVCDCKSWTNKMYVKAELMPHQIRITDIRLEKLQDISEDDCLKEGIIKKWHPPGCRNFYYVPNEIINHVDRVHNSPQEAYAVLIDRICGKGTWERNPYVWVYEFELIK